LTHSYATDMLLLAKLALPWFGNDINRVLWEVDVRQLCAIANIELGNPDGGWVNTTVKERETQLTIEKLRTMRHDENPNA